MVYCYLFSVSYLSNVLFSGFIQFKGNFIDGQINSKYRKKTQEDSVFSDHVISTSKAWFKRRILHAPNQILILVDSNEYVWLI